jgi:hypothetical protein
VSNIPPTHTTSNSEKGSILLSLSLLIFCLALAAVGIAWFLSHDPLPASTREEPQSSVSADRDVLSPLVNIESELASEEEKIQTNLVTRLRQHYATQNDRLTTIDVAAHDDEKYPARVTLTIVSPEATEREVSFLYDLTPWTASMLDNQ